MSALIIDITLWGSVLALGFIAWRRGKVILTASLREGSMDFINITGSIVMGLIAGYLAFKGEASQPWRLFLMTGVLGGYTTFSAFSLDAVLLYERGEMGLALFYVLGSVAFSIAGLFGGLALVRHLA